MKSSLILAAIVGLVSVSAYAYSENTVRFDVQGSYNQSKFVDKGDEGCKIKARGWRNSDGKVSFQVETGNCKYWTVEDRTFSGGGELPAGGAASEGFNYKQTLTIGGSAPVVGEIKVVFSSERYGQGEYKTTVYLHPNY